MARPRSPKPKTAAPRAGSRASRARTARAHADLQTALASLAHEVRTPLNGILVLAELLASSDLPERERGWATALKSAAEHLASLTTVVVDGARAGVGTLTPRREAFAPAALAAALSESLSARVLAKGLTVRTSIADDLPETVLGDPVLIRAAIENLLDNAVKFTERGCITFALDASPLTTNRTQLRFSVTDEGVGLTPADLRQLFRPFARGSARIARRYGGAGLGLAFARQVARTMGGDLTAESTPGAGSCFRFNVAVEVPPNVSEREQQGAQSASDMLRTRRLRILCAEDNPFGRAIFNAILAPLGHCIAFVSSGEAAVTAVGDGGYDLVLMDITMPGLDGIEATRRIRALPGGERSVPIVGLSGHGRAEEEHAAKAAGMNAYLVKPITAAKLMTALRLVASR